MVAGMLPGGLSARGAPPCAADRAELPRWRSAPSVLRRAVAYEVEAELVQFRAVNFGDLDLEQHLALMDWNPTERIDHIFRVHLAIFTSCPQRGVSATVPERITRPPSACARIAAFGKAPSIAVRSPETSMSTITSSIWD